MDLRTFYPGAPGDIRQFTPPACYELNGRQFTFIMDGGPSFELRFTGETALEWNILDSPPQRAEYMCLKGDDTTFLVTFELTGVSPRANHTFVIDLENDLVTRVSSRLGRYPESPYLQLPEFAFGYIRQDRKAEPETRHGFTDELTGNVVKWTYGNEMVTVHVYYCTDFYRITYPPERAGSVQFNDALSKLPSSDEPASYIKIKDGMYLLNITEWNMEMLLRGEIPFRCNTMCFLQNYHRVYQVGRAFGTRTADGAEEHLHLMFGAHGKVFVPEDGYISKLLTDPNPFLGK